MIKTYKYRIVPSEELAIKIDKYLDACRWVYNWGLARNIEHYQTTGKHLTAFDLSRELTQIRNREPLVGIGRRPLEKALVRLDKAYRKFFREHKGFPKFRSRFYDQSMTIDVGLKMDWQTNTLSVTLFPAIPVRISQKFDGKMKQAVIKRTPTGKYFVSITVEDGLVISKPKRIGAKTTAGIDLGGS